MSRIKKNKKQERPMRVNMEYEHSPEAEDRLNEVFEFLLSKKRVRNVQ
jgi:hypothetical protein